MLLAMAVAVMMCQNKGEMTYQAEADDVVVMVPAVFMPHMPIHGARDVGAAFALRSAIMCFGARLFRIRGNNVRSALMRFDPGGLNK